jgi:hypothetical protein
MKLGQFSQPTRFASPERIIRACCLWLFLALAGFSWAVTPPPEPRRVRQPVAEYMNLFAPMPGRQQWKPQVNPFLAYTHLASDFGFIGDGLTNIGWEPGVVYISMPQGLWGGMWHGLAGTGDEMDKVLDFRACFPAFILPKYQPQVVGIEVRAKGKGTLKLEIKSCSQKVMWTRNVQVDSPDRRTVVEELDPQQIECGKFLNWVAEGGSEIALDSIGFIVKTPDIPFDEYVFLASYAKLARCYSERTGFVKDRGHVKDGFFDSVPATGCFALGTALASRMGIVTPEFARAILGKTHDKVGKLAGPLGLLPHFVKESTPGGPYELISGTEYSVVDSSLYFHSMLLAAGILEDKEMEQTLANEIGGLALDQLVDANGFIKHGIREDGVTHLPSVWRDWGGETALVLALAAISKEPPPPKMDPVARIYQGTGFIAEIQSLFYPDFSRGDPDLLTRQSWLLVRQQMLEKQKEYFPKNFPKGMAAEHGFYGISASEGRNGVGYNVGGVELTNQQIISPHYVIMAACLDEKPSAVYALLRSMESENLLPPWGLVENFAQDNFDYLPMQGSLNASFECLGAYHLMKKNRQESDEVYAACHRSPLLRRAASVFYKPTISSTLVRPWLSWTSSMEGALAKNPATESVFHPDTYKLVGSPQ